MVGEDGCRLCARLALGRRELQERVNSCCGFERRLCQGHSRYLGLITGAEWDTYHNAQTISLVRASSKAQLYHPLMYYFYFQGPTHTKLLGMCAAGIILAPWVWVVPTSGIDPQPIYRASNNPTAEARIYPALLHDFVCLRLFPHLDSAQMNGPIYWVAGLVLVVV